MMHRILPLIAALLLAACSDQTYHQYATASEAIAAGERDRGWWPAWMPASAHDVHIQGDLDTNAWWIRAGLTPAAADSLKALLAPAPIHSVRVRVPSRGGNWWFDGLIQRHASTGALDAELFRGSGRPVPRSVTLAFDRNSDRVFVWSGSEGTRRNGGSGWPDAGASPTE